MVPGLPHVKDNIFTNLQGARKRRISRLRTLAIAKTEPERKIGGPKAFKGRSFCRRDLQPSVFDICGRALALRAWLLRTPLGARYPQGGPPLAPHISSPAGRHSRPRSPQLPRSSRSPYEIVTERILKALEEGVVPWRKPWQENTSLPCNAISHRPYHGINLLLLGLSRYRDHRWLTYRQAQELGGHVKPGEKSSIAVFWKQWEPSGDKEESSKGHRQQVPLLRFYHLFNVDQCEGLKLPALATTPRPHHQRIEAAEELVRSIPNPPRLHEGLKIACYYPRIDVVHMPALDSFETPDAYYATLFHELGHATGHQTRLNRPGVTAAPRFGTSDYSREELIAELTSAFCCATLGLDNSLIDNAASYIDGWLMTLRSDAKAIVTASAQAQRAADYLQGSLPSADETPREAS
ncbi:MAG TPA: zincin-like metallopeptidase domain-containing protein [Fimbriimonadaceae bacterium]|nr:zincin-like metallopeptidase domain-containing protein [Fimbriimonadaceae bacterium]